MAQRKNRFSEETLRSMPKAKLEEEIEMLEGRVSQERSDSLNWENSGVLEQLEDELDNLREEWSRRGLDVQSLSADPAAASSPLPELPVFQEGNSKQPPKLRSTSRTGGTVPPRQSTIDSTFLPEMLWRKKVLTPHPTLPKLVPLIAPPSDAFQSIWSAAITECEAIAKSNNGAVALLPLHLWFGVLALGRIEQEDKRRYLPASLYATWEFNENSYVRARWGAMERTMVWTEGEKGTVYLDKETSAICNTAFHLRETCSKKDPCCAARHLVAAMLLHTMRDANLLRFLGDFGFGMAESWRQLEANLEINVRDDKKAWAEVLQKTPLSGTPQPQVSAPLKSLTFPPPRGAEREEIITLLNTGWKQILESLPQKGWSDSMRASLNLLREVQMRQISQLAGTFLSDVEVPFGLTPTSLFYAMLFYGLRSAKSTSSGKEARGELPRALATTAGWTGEDVLKGLRQSLYVPGAESPLDSRLQLITPALADIFQHATEFASPGSEVALTVQGDGVGIIATRHVFIALLLQAHNSGKLNQPFFLPIRPLQLPDGPTLDQTHLLAQLKGYISEHLQDQGDDHRRWNAVLERVGEGLRGSDLSSSRFSKDEELGLDVTRTADAVAQIFQSARPDSKAPSEFILALYGEWGRGKTTLIKKVAAKLEIQKYHHIHFSAWKYPSRPEVWVHLYERIREEASQYSLWQRLRISFRLGLLDAGWFPLLAGLLLLFCAAFLPAQENSGLWGLLISSGALLSGTFILRTTALGKLFVQRYLKAPDHSEKLGLQAVIGHDLKNLLRVWVEGPSEEKIPHGQDEMAHPSQAWVRKINFACFQRGWWGSVAASALVLGIAAVLSLRACQTYQEQLQASQAPQNISRASAENAGYDATYFSAVHSTSAIGGTLLKLKPPLPIPAFPWQLVTACGLGALCAVVSIIIISQPVLRPKMVLLTVDDLDRCDPLQMLAVVDSLRLFVDDEAMSQRMQMAMLMDRALLEKALMVRAEETNMAPLHEKDIWRYCQIQREKLFVCELEMPALDKTKRDQIIDKILPLPSDPGPKTDATERHLAHQILQQDSGGVSHAGQRSSLTNSDRPQTSQPKPSQLHQQQPSFTAPQAREDDPPRETSSSSEILALRAALQLIPPHLLTPRSIRMIKIRFELARLLLKTFKVPAPPDAVAYLIIRRFVPDMPKRYVGGSDVEHIVSHVTCDCTSA